MSGTTDDRYLEWLYELVAAARNGRTARSHWMLLRQLYTTEFVWLVANDDNRVADGLELRNTFVTEQCADGVDPDWMNLGCSMLEMLVALSRRASYESTKAPDEWFWIFMDNLGLTNYTDIRYERVHAWDQVHAAMERVIYRTYDHAGRGGLFPLKFALNDQRKIELWYQLAEYLLEGN